MKVGYKFITICILILLLTFIMPTFLPFIRNNLYHLDVFIWLLLFIISIFLIDSRTNRVRVRKAVAKTTLILTIFYLLVYFSIGLFLGYARNPLVGDIFLFLKNLLFIVFPVIFRELLRNRLILSGNYKLNYVLITLVFIVSEMGLNSILSLDNSRAIFEYVFGDLLYIIIENSLLSYLSYTGGIYSLLAYILPMKIKNIILPILPDLDWFFSSLSLIVLLVLIIAFVSTEFNDKFFRQRKVRKKIPVSYIDFAIVLLLALFIAGVFKYMPVVVLSNSMLPVFGKGDVVIIDKIDDSNKSMLQVGDIIDYQLEGYFVIHRIIEVVDTNDGVYYITQGDNNNDRDYKEVYPEQVHGVVKCSVPVVGFPVVWLNEIFNNQDVSVGKG